MVGESNKSPDLRITATKVWTRHTHLIKSASDTLTWQGTHTLSVCKMVNDNRSSIRLDSIQGQNHSQLTECERHIYSGLLSRSEVRLKTFLFDVTMNKSANATFQ